MQFANADICIAAGAVVGLALGTFVADKYYKKRGGQFAYDPSLAPMNPSIIYDRPVRVCGGVHAPSAH
jgi:hypothetical protein